MGFYIKNIFIIEYRPRSLTVVIFTFIGFKIWSSIVEGCTERSAAFRFGCAELVLSFNTYPGYFKIIEVTEDDK